jgi:hypothetical protein
MECVSAMKTMKELVCYNQKQEATEPRSSKEGIWQKPLMKGR